MKKNIIHIISSLLVVALIIGAFCAGRFFERKQSSTIEEQATTTTLEAETEIERIFDYEITSVSILYNTSNPMENWEAAKGLRKFYEDTCYLEYFPDYSTGTGIGEQFQISYLNEIVEIINDSVFEEYTFDRQFDESGRVTEHDTIDRVLIISDGNGHTMYIIDEYLINQVEEKLDRIIELAEQ